MPRLRLNCWLYMLWLLFRLKGRVIFFVERVGPHGLIPHTGVIKKGDRELTLYEYKATHRKRSFFDRDGSNVLLFKGRVRIIRYRMIGVSWGDTLEEAQQGVPTFMVNDGGPEYSAHHDE